MVPRYYQEEHKLLKRSKAKNAQEAHEAIRPTQPQLHPQNLPAGMPRQNKLLYELIWRRTLASQMAASKIKQVGVDVATSDGHVVLRATSSELQFPGYQAAYASSFFRGLSSAPSEEESEEEEAPKAEAVLSLLKEGDRVQLAEALQNQHFTKPPPHFSEASLVKNLEELGIGRPSTYASILKLLQERGYVSKDGKALHAESLGRVLSAFLEKYFQRYVDFGFTSSVEDLLDDISAGKLQWRGVLQDFWGPFHHQLQSVGKVSVREVIDELDALLGPHLFDQEGQSEAEARKCPLCGSRLTLLLSRGGGFIGCSSYPKCKFQRPLSPTTAAGSSDGEDSELMGAGRLLGVHPETGTEVRMKSGRYGTYVEVQGDQGSKPQRASIPPNLIDNFSLESAVELLQWPKVLGNHPETQEDVCVAVGGFGPYVKCGPVNATLPQGSDPAEVSLEEAVLLIDEKKASPRFQAKLKKLAANTKRNSDRKSGKQPGKKPALRKALNSYQLFCQWRRGKLKEEGVEMAPTEIMKQLAEDWRSLTEDQKGEWKSRAESESARPDSENNGSANTADDDSDEGPKTQGAKKRSASPYIRFCNQRRQELKEAGTSMKPTEVMSMLGREWRELSEQEKAAFREQIEELAA